ncbi:hypothetical protein ACFE04_020179 [Oxalis oulophora]
MTHYTIHSLLFFILYFVLIIINTTNSSTTTTLELTKNFIATPNPSSTTSFQPLLQDSTGTFSLGFLQLNNSKLALTVIHTLSNQQLWVANPTTLAPWSDKTQLIFNGTLLLINSHNKEIFWSTGLVNADKVVLLNNSNLQLLDGGVGSVVYESFGFPGNTLVQNQNFTSAMQLVNGLYSMRLGENFVGLYASFDKYKDQIYLKHTALQAKAVIVKGGPPIYARVDPDGFLGMYQSSDVTPVDIDAFNSYQREITGFRFVRIEPDGNLRGYYWDSSSNGLVLDYESIRDTCQLPSPCGSYGLCKSGSGCSCLDNRTVPTCHIDNKNNNGKDLCNGGSNGKYSVFRRAGVELPFKELMRYETVSSLETCEGICDKNCSCWGAVYNNVSGFCYIVDYPIQTVLGIGDVSKVGYFKVVEGTGKRKMDVSVKVMIVILCVVVLTFIFGVGYSGYRIWKKKKRDVGGFLVEENGMSPGPYKNLGSASFNKTIELSNSNNR